MPHSLRPVSPFPLQSGRFFLDLITVSISAAPFHLITCILHMCVYVWERWGGVGRGGMGVCLGVCLGREDGERRERQRGGRRGKGGKGRGEGGGGKEGKGEGREEGVRNHQKQDLKLFLLCF